MIQHQHLEKLRVEDLARRSRSAGIGNCLLFLLYFFSVGGFSGIFPLYIEIAATSLPIGSFLRLWLAKKVSTLSAQKWHNLFTTLITAISISWAVLTFGVVAETQITDNVILSLFVIAGLTSAGGYSLMNSNRDFYIFQITLTITLAICLFRVDILIASKLSVAIILLLFFSFISRQRQNGASEWLQLMTKESETKTLVEAFPGGIMLFAANNLVQFNNWLHQWAPAKDSLLEQPLEKLPLPNILKEKLSDFFNSKVKRSVLELDLPTPAGVYTYQVIMEKMALLHDYCIVVLLDIHEQRQSQMEILRQRAVLEESSKMVALGEISAGLAHEINNPLSIISGKAQQSMMMLNRGKLDAHKLSENFNLIHQTSLRISAIIKGLRSFARDGEKDPMEKTSLKQILENVTMLSGTRLKNHDIKLSLPENMDNTLLLCRAVQIEQVLINLLNNSLDAIDDLQKKWIRIEVKEETHHTKIYVTDSGSGIPENLRTKILQPFFTTKEVGKGTGLGLHISSGIIHDHGGKLWFDHSSPNTCVVIELPRYPKIQKSA